MKSKAKFLLVALMLIVGCLALALVGCKPDKPTPPTPPDYSGELSSIIVNSLDANLKDGFAVDFKGNVGFAFDDEDKSQYNWNYDYSIQANLFSTTMSDLAIEIKQHGSEDIVFGLYNKGENLYFTLNDGTNVTSYNFENAPLLKAVRALVYNNVAEVPDNIKNIYIGEQTLAELANEYIPGVLPMLIDTETMTKNGNDYTAQFEFAEVRELLFGALGSLDLGDISETITNLLDSVLPQDISAELVFKTDGTNLKGLEVNDAAVSTATDDGTFNFKLDAGAKLFQNANNTLDVKVPTALTSLPTSKILSAAGSGIIDVLNKDGSKVNAIDWKINANLDIVKMAEYNFIMDNEEFNDNFFYLQISMNNKPLLDIGYDPDSFMTNHLKISIHVLDLANKLGLDISGFAGFANITSGYWMLDIDWNALPELINVITGLVGGQSEVASVSDFELGLGDIWTALGPDLAGTLQGLLGNGAMTLVGHDSSFEFGITNKDNEVNVLDKMLYMPAGNGLLKERNYEQGTVGEALRNATIATDKLIIGEGDEATTYNMLQVYDGSNKTNLQKVLGADMPVTYDELMSYVGLKVMYDPDNTYYLDGSKLRTSKNALSKELYPNIKAISGVDKDKIGVLQEVTVYTSMIDGKGTLQMLRKMNSLVRDAAGIDLAAMFDIDLPLNSFKAYVMLSEKDQDTAITPTIRIDGKAYDKDKEYLPGVSSSITNVKVTATYKNNKDAAIQYPEDKLTKTVTVTGGNLVAADALVQNAAVKVVNTWSNSVSKNIANTEDISLKLKALGVESETIIKIKTPDEIEAVWFKDSYSVGNDTYSFSTVGNLTENMKLKLSYYKEGTEEVESTIMIEPPASSVSLINGAEMTGLTDGLGSTFTKVGTLLLNVKLANGKDIECKVNIIPASAVYEAGITDFKVADDKTSVSGKIDISGIVDKLIGDGSGMNITLNIVDKTGKEVKDATIAIGDKKESSVNMDLPSIMKENITLDFTITGLDANKTYVISPVIKKIATNETKVYAKNNAYTGKASDTLERNTSKNVMVESNLNNLFYAYRTLNGTVNQFVLKWVGNKYYFVSATNDAIRYEAIITAKDVNGQDVQLSYDDNGYLQNKFDGSMDVAMKIDNKTKITGTVSDIIMIAKITEFGGLTGLAEGTLLNTDILGMSGKQLVLQLTIQPATGSPDVPYLVYVDGSFYLGAMNPYNYGIDIDEKYSPVTVVAKEGQSGRIEDGKVYFGDATSLDITISCTFDGDLISADFTITKK